MKAIELNLTMLTTVAQRLGPLLDKVVFCGGCATSLLITDEAVPDVRATQDVDMIIEAMTQAEYHDIERQLRDLGFTQNIHDKDAPICRWNIDGINVDIMPPDEKILGFSNQWYKEAIGTAQNIQLSDALEIKLVTAPYFLATKLEAFFGRGKNDYMSSHDLEDIITVIDGRNELIDELGNIKPDLRNFLNQSFSHFLEDQDFHDSLPGHLLPDESSQARLSILLPKIEKIAGL